MSSLVIEARVYFFTTPSALRKLADDMEQKIKTAKLGESLGTAIGLGDNVHLIVTADQEAPEYKEILKARS